ncbi:putative phospholipid-transporting ATPase DNF3 [Podospora australis]|uniref:Phospholipid-transporting ATPase n=1 Tax=Podospora australis TaxID=1536484 RepID=A0AAN7ALL8_9PEZI|nr:putative phospholipid-transporting ATPase DNF3 [Podospora australis]
MASKSPSDAAEALRGRLEHIELQDSQSPRASPRASPLPSPSLAATQSRGAYLNVPTSNSPRVSIESRRSLNSPATTSRARFEGQEPRRQPPPSLKLYTIDSHTPGPNTTRQRLQGAQQQQHGGVRIEESRISLTRPRQTFDESRANARATMAAIEEIDAVPPRSWIERQKQRKKKLTGQQWDEVRRRAGTAYKRYILEGLLRQKPIPPSKDGRHIPIKPGHARRKPFQDERRNSAFIGNSIRSSRYTLWSFLPKQLWFQFSKLANFYFLVIGILQMIPGLSTTGTYTTIVPLIAFVTLSMAKEGYDDYRRYKLDVAENRSTAWVLDPEGTVKGRSRIGGSRVQEFLKRERSMSDDAGTDTQMADLESVPSELSKTTEKWARVDWQDIRVGDIIRLRRDDNIPADIILLHSTDPNGVAYIETMALDGETNLKSKQACPLLAKHCTSERDLSSIDAEVISEDPNLDLYNYEGRITVNGETKPLTLNEVVFRGSTLRNTIQATGLVINTGEECKIRMNANKNVRAKAPEIQNMVNRIVILLVFFVLALSAGCTLGYALRESEEDKAFYLNRARVGLGQVFIANLIAYNTILPLSLYVSLEIIKLGQLLFLQDVEMYDETTDTPFKVNTTTILENLGQVTHVFSDKTGTLTENLMRFRKMSVAGTAWLHDMDIQREEEAKAKGALQQTIETTGKGRQSFSARHHDQELLDTPAEGRPSISGWRSTVRPNHSQPELKTDDLIRYIQQKPNSPFSQKARHFILCLALCHTCLPEKDDNGEITYQAASPDELALVEAASELGLAVIERSTQAVTLRVSDGGRYTEQTYEVLDVIEFSSQRKRMSIIVRTPDKKLCIFTKGADSVILPRLRQRLMAIQTASAIEARASMRRSVEQRKSMQRRSLQSPVRRSMDLIRRASSYRNSLVITDGIDNWLSNREADGVDEQTGNEEAYHTPRPSMVRSRSLELSRLANRLDGMVDESLTLNESAVFERCFQHVDDFATEGLRTLIYAYRYLEEDEYKKWKETFHEATTSLVNRQAMIEDAAELIEKDFDLAGATAIEDKLQPGVPETIDKLRRANIKVWMLTGDKRETAINIAHSARICKPFSEVYILDVTQGELQERITSILTDVARGMVPHSVLVIDGGTLTVVQEDEQLRVLFFDLVARIDSVICCRASPSQKAGLVKHIRHQSKKNVTLAIGDGANDIAMIQASHVGIGISGREGLQAARVADYSIAKFRFLQRLLFVHGRWCYARSGRYIVATFWKEIVFYLCQALYQRYNGYTGTSLFESTSLAVFNTIFTSLPVIVPGIVEQDLSAETLLAVPELYSFGQKCKAFNFKLYLGWMFMAVSEAVIIFCSVYYLYSLVSHPVETDLYAVGTLAFSLAVVFINVKLLLLEVRNHTYVTVIALILSIAGWWLWIILLSVIMEKKLTLYMVGDTFLERFGKERLWWMVHFIALSALITFELAATSLRKSLWPTDQDLAQELESFDGVMDVMREHAGEHGEGGAGMMGAPVARADEDVMGTKAADVASLKTVTSTSTPGPEMQPVWSGGRGLGVPPRQMPVRRYTEEYIRPRAFTLPEEEGEDILAQVKAITTTREVGTDDNKNDNDKSKKEDVK